MSQPIRKSLGLANRVFRSILVAILTVFLLGWFGLSFSLQAGLCTHSAGKAAMHGGGLCTWLCAAHGQELSLRSPNRPSVLTSVGFLAEEAAGQIRPSRLGASESRGPPTMAARHTWLS